MKNTIKRANTLNESHYRLKEVSQRVLGIAIEQAQDIKEQVGQDLILAGTKVIVSAEYYAKVYNVNINTAYDALRIALEDLYQAEYRWKEIDEQGNIIDYKARFVSRIGYLNGHGAIEFVLTSEARNHILRLNRNYTWYQLQQLTNLSKYSIRLYELLCQYRSTGKIYKTVDELRFTFGLIGDEYSRMSNFKMRVLDFAIDEILRYTDVESLSYEQKKQGKVITDFIFSFKFKANQPTRDANTIDAFTGKTDNEQARLPPSDISTLTEKQIRRVVRSQKFISDYGDLVNESSIANQNLASWTDYMSDMLVKQPELFNQRSMREYLDDEPSLGW